MIVEYSVVFSVILKRNVARRDPFHRKFCKKIELSIICLFCRSGPEARKTYCLRVKAFRPDYKVLNHVRTKRSERAF